MLAHLARRTGDLPLLVVLATRPRTGHEPDVPSIFAAVEDVEPIRLERRGTRDVAATAWAGLQAGTLALAARVADRPAAA